MKSEPQVAPSKETLYEAVLSSFRLLDALTVAATIYFSGSLLVRIASTGETRFFGIPISYEYGILVLIICTVLHAGVSRYIVYYLRIGWRDLDQGSRVQLYYKITSTGALVTKGAERFRDRVDNNNGFLFVRVPPEDPPSVVHWAVFLLATFACMSFEVSPWLFGSFLVGLVLSLVNWQIGSSWLVALADFGRNSDRSLYFDSDEILGPRYVGTVSGPWRMGNADIFTFVAVAVVDALFRPLTGLVLLLWIFSEILVWVV